MKTPLLPLSSVAAFAVSLASGVQWPWITQLEPCAVRAWVRAEDLSPDHISRGELRLKVTRKECANQIASVALRLQLDEFGEFKFLKKGAVLPEVRVSKESAPVGYEDWMGSDIIMDYQAHDEGLSDPDLWTTFPCPSSPPFTVAVPAVNYPPVVMVYRSLYGPISRHSCSSLGYHYTAVVTFTDGRTENVPAGHTAFIPSSQPHVQAPFTRNSTFEYLNLCEMDDLVSRKHDKDLEKCLPEAQRSVFRAEINLAEGNVVEKGRPLRGRVTVHAIREGSTAISDIQVDLRSLTRDHWAQAQAAAGGDAEFSNATSGACRQGTGDRELYAESVDYATLFDDEDDVQAHLWRSMGVGLMQKPITPAQPYFDFEIEVSGDTPVDFTSYYSTSETFLHVRLSVVYSWDVVKCMYPDHVKSLSTEDADDAAETDEEGLWDMYTPVGKPAAPASRWYRTMTLETTVPITVVANTTLGRPVAHYLAPSGAKAPVLRSGVQLEMPTSFPPAQPIFTVEGLADTSARLMQSGSTDPYQSFTNMSLMLGDRSEYPDPAKNYQGGNFAGVLWKKKLVAEERGILPLRDEVEGGAQQTFSVAV
ncbi:hypothetical protein B0H14DRAFT_2867794 [Mycena olivaceomarginata]|nr:hypothetical protein B0H14DRAFT_2867794 [Mycena olivaceomarginata]